MRTQLKPAQGSQTRSRFDFSHPIILRWCLGFALIATLLSLISGFTTPSPWDNTRKELAKSVAAYQKAVSEHARLLKDYNENSPVVESANQAIQIHKERLAKSLAELDAVDKTEFDRFQSQMDQLQLQHDDLVHNQGMRPTAEKVLDLSKQLEKLRNQQAAHKPGADRAAGLATLDFQEFLRELEKTIQEQSREAGSEWKVKVKEVEIVFHWCPPGNLIRDGDRTPVEIARGFWIMETEVTQDLWESVMGSRLDWNKGAGPKYPVYNVDYHKAVEFCTKLTELMPTDASPLSASQILLSHAKITSNEPPWVIQLPNETQWEYSARAGSATVFCFGDDEARLDEYAWYYNNSDNSIQTVRGKKPNAWGLFDMHGSVWEWCLDGDILKNDADPIMTLGLTRVFRGGSWANTAGACQSSARLSYEPSRGSPYLGFRAIYAPSN